MSSSLPTGAPRLPADIAAKRSDIGWNTFSEATQVVLGKWDLMRVALAEDVSCSCAASSRVYTHAYVHTPAHAHVYAQSYIIFAAPTIHHHLWPLTFFSLYALPTHTLQPSSSPFKFLVGWS